MFPLKDDAPLRSFPFVNTLLIAVNFVVFIYEWRLPVGYLDHVFIPTYGLIPAHYGLFLRGYAGAPLALLVPLFTSMFLHGGWLHLLGNMWMLYLFGDNVEDVFGHVPYLVFYLGCGLVAAAAQIGFAGMSYTPTIGASGAIAGVMGAYFVCFPRARVFTLIFVVIFFFFWRLPAWVILGYWFLVQALSGAGALALGQSGAGGIAWFAHIGGFLCGLLWVLAARKRPQTRWS